MTIRIVSGASSSGGGGTVNGRWTAFALTESGSAVGLLGSQDSCAAYDATSNRTFVAIKSTDNSLGILQVDHAAQRVDGPYFVALPVAPFDDIRGVPSLCVANNGTIVVIFGANESLPVLARSVLPRDVRGGWAVTQPNLPGTLHHIGVESASGNLYALFRAGLGITAHGPTYPTHEFGTLSRSTDGGTTWTSLGAIVDTNAFNTTDAAKDFYPTSLEIINGRVYFVFGVAHGTAHDGAPDGIRSDVLCAYYDTATSTVKTVAGVDQGAIVDTRAKLDAITVAFRTYAYLARLRVNSATDIGVLWKSLMNDGMIGVETAIWNGTAWTIADTGSRSDYMFTGANLRRSATGWEAYCPAGRASLSPKLRASDDAPGAQYIGAGHDLEYLTAPASGTPWTSQGAILHRRDVVGHGVGGVHHVRNSSSALKVIVSTAGIFNRSESLPVYGLSDEGIDPVFLEGRRPSRPAEAHHNLISVQPEIAPLAGLWRQHDLSPFVPDNAVEVLLRFALVGSGAGANGTVKVRRYSTLRQAPYDAETDMAVDGASTLGVVFDRWVPLGVTKQVEVLGSGNLATYSIGLRGFKAFGGDDLTLTHGTGGGQTAPASTPTSPPVNTVPPQITGTPQIGQPLTVSTGNWNANPAPTFTQQWRRGTTTPVNISGATGTQYTPVSPADDNATLTVAVTATNEDAPTGVVAISNAVVVAAAPPPPTEPTLPTGFANQSFTAADGTTVQTLANMVKHTASQFDAVVTSNRARSSSATGGTILYYDSRTPPSADYAVHASLALLADNNSSSAGPFVRLSTTGADVGHITGYWANYTTSGDFLELRKYVGGGGASQVLASVTIPIPTIVEIEAVGSTLSVYADGVLVLGPITDATPIAGPGVAGFRIGGNATATTGVHISALAAVQHQTGPAFTVTQDKATRVLLDAGATAGTTFSWTIDGTAVATGRTASVLAPSLGPHSFALTVDGTTTYPAQSLDVVWQAKTFSAQYDTANATSWNPDPPHSLWTSPIIDPIGPWPNLGAVNRTNETPSVQTLIFDPTDPTADVSFQLHLGDKATSTQTTGDRITAMFQPSYGGPSVGGGPSGQWHYDWSHAGLAAPIDITGDHGAWVTNTAIDPVPRFWRFEYRWPSVNNNFTAATWKWNTMFELRSAPSTAVFSLIPQTNFAVKIYGRSNQVLYTFPLVPDQWENFVFEIALSPEPTKGYVRIWKGGVNVLAGVAPGDVDGKVFFGTMISAAGFIAGGAKLYHSLVTTDYTTQLDMRNVAVGLSMNAVMAI